MSGTFITLSKGNSYSANLKKVKKPCHAGVSCSTQSYYIEQSGDSSRKNMINNVSSFSDFEKSSSSKVLYFCEFEEGKQARHLVDFNSPKTVAAALQLGVTFESCLRK